MSEPPPTSGEPPVNPGFTPVETLDSGGFGTPIAAIISGVMNPSRVRRGGCVAYSIVIGFIGFTKRYTHLFCRAVFGGEPRVHQGFTRYTGGFTLLAPSTSGGIRQQAAATQHLIMSRNLENYDSIVQNHRFRRSTPVVSGR